MGLALKAFGCHSLILAVFGPKIASQNVHLDKTVLL